MSPKFTSAWNLEVGTYLEIGIAATLLGGVLAEWMGSVLRREERTLGCAPGDTGTNLSRAAASQGMPRNPGSYWTLEEAGGLLPWSLQRGHPAADALTSDIWAPDQHGGAHSPCSGATQNVGLCSGSPRKLIHMLLNY